MKNFPFYLCCVSAFSISVLSLLTACGGDPESQASSTTSMQTPPKLVGAAPADDTITFPEPRKNYTLLHSPSSISVTHNTSKVTTTHLNAKRIQFSDMSVNLMVAQNSKTISSKDLNSLIDLYIAFFNRVPDADGLNYWIDNFKAGATLDQIAANFYLVAKQYPDITGYNAKMNDEAFVRLIYKNVLGRVGSTAPPDSHVDYWVGDLKNGLSKEKLVAVMLVAAREYAKDKEWGWMTTLLNNKVELGKYFALEQGLTYNTYEDSIRNTVALTAAVTPTDYIKAKNLLTLKNHAFNLPISSGSGMGEMNDCFNPALYAVGNTIFEEKIQTVTGWGLNDFVSVSKVRYVKEYKVTGPVNFKGNSVLALVGTSIRYDGFSSNNIDPTLSYIGLEKNVYLSYGFAFEDYDNVTNQKKSTLYYNSPALKIPYSLAVNESFTQMYTEHKENALTNTPLSQEQDRLTLTFLGIEDITIPAGNFSSCKIKYATPHHIKGEPDLITYVWFIASGPYRGMQARLLNGDDSELWLEEANKLLVNGK